MQTMDNHKDGRGPVDLRSVLRKEMFVDRAEQPRSENVDTGASLPDEHRVAKALNFLCDTDAKYARATARLEATELRLKQAREVAFLSMEGTQAERSALANTSEAVKGMLKEVEEAYYQKELLKAQRATAIVLIDVWRSLNANRRQSV